MCISYKTGMDGIEANKIAKRVFNEWKQKRTEVEHRAKENSAWKNIAIDFNSHLLRKINRKTKEKLDVLKFGKKEALCNHMQSAFCVTFYFAL